MFPAYPPSLEKALQASWSQQLKKCKRQQLDEVRSANKKRWYWGGYTYLSITSPTIGLHCSQSSYNSAHCASWWHALIHDKREETVVRSKRNESKQLLVDQCPKVHSPPSPKQLERIAPTIPLLKATESHTCWPVRLMHESTISTMEPEVIAADVHP